jgi:hypothetical protein
MFYFVFGKCEMAGLFNNGTLEMRTGRTSSILCRRVLLSVDSSSLDIDISGLNIEKKEKGTRNILETNRYLFDTSRQW